MRRGRWCAALTTCVIVAGTSTLSVTVAGCFDFDFGGNWFADASLLGDACLLFCDGPLFGSSGCPHGTASCGDDASACETPTLSNDSNCGGCGVRCPSGHTCAQGSCFQVQEIARWPGRVAFPYGGLAVADGYAFVAMLEGSLVAVPVSGGTPRTLVGDQVFSLVADSQGVSFLDQTDAGALLLETMSPTASAPRILLADASAVQSLVSTNDASVFYTVQSSPNGPGGLSLVELPWAGGASQVLATDPDPVPGQPMFAVAGDRIDWLDLGAVLTETLADADVDAGSQLSGGGATAVGASRNAVYVLTTSGATRYDIPSATWSTILTSPPQAASFTVDDSALYVLVGRLFDDGEITRVAMDGGVTMLAGAQVSFFTVAIDDSYVYWLALDVDDAGLQDLVLRRMAKSS